MCYAKLKELEDDIKNKNNKLISTEYNIENLKRDILEIETRLQRQEFNTDEMDLRLKLNTENKKLNRLKYTVKNLESEIKELNIKRYKLISNMNNIQILFIYILIIIIIIRSCYI